MQTRTFLDLLRPIFAQKIKTALPQRNLGAEVEKELPEEPFEFQSGSISVKTFFFFFLESPVSGAKNRSSFRFRPENPAQFWINRLNLI